ncbi:MAG: serine protease [Croceibacterium sp.]
MTGGTFWQRIALALAALWVLVPGAAQADPSDISAASRGVVRVVILQVDGDQVTPVSHGTGFAVGPERIVTNAHVVQEAQGDQGLTIGLVPSDGGDAVYGRIIAVDQRRDLALIATTSPMRLPPLTVSGNASVDTGAVTAVGYPMNVDRAQGLSLADIFHAQPPVKSTGALSGRRPARDFDSLLHTAPIARGSSGGPLLDECGRVLGVNSFGTDSGNSANGGADAEFYFAVSTRELLPFLRANGVTARVNGAPCRSLADVEAQERQQSERAQIAAQAHTVAEEQRTAIRREQLRRETEFALLAERESGLALTLILLMAAMGAAGLAIHAHHNALRHNAEIGFVLAAVAVVSAAVAWVARPDFTDIDRRLDAAMKGEQSAGERPAGTASSAGALICVIDSERTRVTGADTVDVPLQWSDDGCVNGRTQYGAADGAWARVFVPGDEEVVSVNRFEPATREYRVDRFLLDRAAMARVRKARGEFQAPACGAGPDAAREFGARQAAMLSLVPPRPDERLVYKCSPSH